MWQPTHVKVAVNQARNLLTKGKNGTNDAFVVIGIGKEKFHTSIKLKSSKTVEWREECELEIPSQGNKASIQLTVYHHNSLGIDEFLGQVAVPLSDFDVYEKPKYRFYKLKGKHDKEKKKQEKERGELEVLVNFIVKSGSFLETGKKEKTKSSTSLKSIGGSLMSFGGNKDKHGIKDFARSVSSKMDKIAKRKKSKTKREKIPTELMESRQYYGHADPGVISDEEDDFRFDDEVKVFTRHDSPHSSVSRGSSFVPEIGFDDDVASHTSHESTQVIGTSLLSYDTPNIFGEANDNQRFVRTTSQVTISPIDRTTDLGYANTPPDATLPIGDHFLPSEEINRYYTPALETPQVLPAEAVLRDKNTSQTILEYNTDAVDKNKDNFVDVVDTDSKFNVPEEEAVPVAIRHVSKVFVESDNVNSNQSKSSISGRNKRRKPLRSSQADENIMQKFDNDESSLYETPKVGYNDNRDILSDSKKSNGTKAPTVDSGAVTSVSETANYDEQIQPVDIELSRKNSFNQENSLADEWGRKLFNLNSLTGSHDDVSLSGSKSNLNTSRASSTQDIRTDDFNREVRHGQPKVKALTLSGKITAEDVENFEARKTKRKAISAFKNKIFNKSSGKLAEEDCRFVEGGNDRVPAPPTRTSRLPQEIHDKFAGKSREDLLEMIMSLQGIVDKQVRRTGDLEDYLDNLLLRVMESTPQILHSKTKEAKKKGSRMFY